MNARKWIALGLAGLMALGTTACSTGGAQKELKKNEDGIITDKVTIKFAYNAWDQSIAAWTAALEAANRNLEESGSGVRIEGVKIPAPGWNDYYTKIATQMAANKGPDIGEIAESFMPTLITKNMALDITDYIQRDIDMNAYFAATFEGSAARDGRYYGLPSANNYMIMYYNKDMFREKGIPEPSKDWNNAISFEEVRSIAKEFSGGSGADRTFGFSAGPYMGYIGMYTKSNGGDNVFDADGNCTLTSPESLEVYQWFDDMLNDGSLPRPSDTKIISAADMFKDGKLVMMVDGSWTFADFRNVDKFEVGLAAVPAGKGTAYSSMFLNAYVMWKGNQNNDASWEALRALFCKEAWDELTKAGFCGLPVHRQSLEDCKSFILGDKFSQEDTDCFISGLDHTLKLPYNEYYEQADQAANAIMDEWLLGQINSEEYAAKVKKIVEDAKANAEAERAKAAES